MSIRPVGVRHYLSANTQKALTYARPMYDRSGQAGNNPVREVSEFYRLMEGDSARVTTTKTGGRPAGRKGCGAGERGPAS